MKLRMGTFESASFDGGKNNQEWQTTFGKENAIDFIKAGNVAFHFNHRTGASQLCCQFVCVATFGVRACSPPLTFSSLSSVFPRQRREPR